MGRGDRSGSKRKRESIDSESASALATGPTLSHLKEARGNGEQGGQDGQDPGDAEENGGAWQTVERRSKKQKKGNSNYPSVSHSSSARLQNFVKISDLQGLVLYLLADGNAPQWLSVRHHHNFDKVVVLMLPGLEADMFDGTIPIERESLEEVGRATNGEIKDPASTPHSAPAKGQTLYQQTHQKLKISPDDYYPTQLAAEKLPGPLKPLADIFPHIWPIKTPGEYNRLHSPLYAMLNAPIPKPREDKNKKGPKPPPYGKTWQNKRTALTEYIVPKGELAENGFAMHPAYLENQEEKDHEAARRYKACQSVEDGWTDILDITSPSEGCPPESEIEAGSILGGRTLLVADCEMVTTTEDKFALARLSLIDWDGKVVLDELVKPPDPVKDYLTQYSGITKELLDTATLTRVDIQQRLRELLTPRTILAGHSLDSDLKALKISYPFVVDTALLYPHPKGPPQKSSLKWLTQKYLNRDIQNRGARGHDSIEDAQACLDLIKEKCEKGKAWGTPDATGEPIFKRLARAGQTDTPHASNGAAKPKTGAVVDWGDPSRGFGGAATVSVACENDDDVVAGVKRALLGDSLSAIDSDVPPGGCDFVWARLRELEALRGWYNRTKTPDAADRLAKALSNPAPTTNDRGSTGDVPAETTRPGDLDTAALAAAVSRAVEHVSAIWTALPERTAFIVYSGSGDPRELARLQALNAEFKKAYATMKWDELPVQWTDVEEQALKSAAIRARSGIGFIAAK